MTAHGELVLVATPIGNLADLSPRAAEVIGTADVVCCEDTRHSGLMFSRLGLNPKRFLSLHEHNEAERAGEVVGLVASGLTVALVTDAGMPGVSDPGRRVVDAVHEAGGRVSAVPGPSAAVAAVAVAGFGRGRWSFEGFVPRKGRERAERLAEIASSSVPVVLFESPRRVASLLGDLEARCGAERRVAVCRELTKLHEEVWRGPLGASLDRWPAATARGEFAIVLDGAPPALAAVPTTDELAHAVSGLVESGLSRRDAVSEVSDRTGVARREVYDAAVRAARRRPAEGL